jgi:hypothetical protein
MRMTKAARSPGPPLTLMLPLLLAVPLLSSCGTEEKPPAPNADDLYPLAVGDSWLYRETDQGDETLIRYEVLALETKTFGHGVGERDVFVIENTFPTGDSGSDTDAAGGSRVQFVSDDGTVAPRLRHEVYDTDGILTKFRDYVPGFLRFDRGKATEGTQWVEELTRYSDPLDGTGEVEEEESYLYEVMAPETVTVPAGTFDCVVWKRIETASTGETKMYYFAPGVGKVREITGAKVEELLSYTVGQPADGGV